MNIKSQYLDDIIDFTSEGSPIYGCEVENSNFSFIEGLCAVDINNINQSRNRQLYLKNVIKPMILRGEIDDGLNTPYDDRKFRIDKT